MLFKNWKQIIENGKTPELKKARRDILEILSYALLAVDPYKIVKSRFNGTNISLENLNIDCSTYKNIYLIGFGKASVGMSQAVSDSVKIKRGIIITNDSYKKVHNDYLTTYVGGHPIPNQNCIIGTEKILEMVRKCKEKDLLIVVISGGGSALLCKPRVSLKDFQQTTDLLLKSGATINEINTIRKHISFVKGGRLIEKAKCKVISFIISDIVSDPIEHIASGPTYPDLSSFDDVNKILNKYGLREKFPSETIRIIESEIQRNNNCTPKKSNSVFENVNNIIVANNRVACNAAELKAKKLGYKTELITTSLTGEAKDVGKNIIEKIYDDKGKKLFISGGETTVTIKGNGKGGRNQEMVLGVVSKIDGKDTVFSSFATDGIDGESDAAGAIADGFSLTRARKRNLNPEKYLKLNNSNVFFDKLGDLLITGSTGTNVMDMQIIIT
jgi:hydroxypyruvate reductase/glycerate 2-kinase